MPIFITVTDGKLANNYATISANLSSYSYVGYPIVVPIILSIPSATTLTLSIKVN
jgi:hypothetical protein